MLCVETIGKIHRLFDAERNSTRDQDRARTSRLAQRDGVIGNLTDAIASSALRASSALAANRSRSPVLGTVRISGSAFRLSMPAAYRVLAFYATMLRVEVSAPRFMR